MADLAQCLDDIRDFLEAADDAHRGDLQAFSEDIEEAAGGLAAVTDHLTAPEVPNARE